MIAAIFPVIVPTSRLMEDHRSAAAAKALAVASCAYAVIL
jgi:hypothetical protein